MSFALIIASLILGPVFAEHDFRIRVSHKRELYSEKDVSAEIDFGRNLAAKILGKYSLIENERLSKYVALVGAGIAAQSGRPEITYYFGIIDTDDVNAYACPGGYIFITKGAVKNMSNEAELAGVLSHEIAHVNQRHVVKQLAIKGSDGSLSAGVASLVGGTTASGKVALDQMMDKAMKLLFEEGIEKKDEAESDILAAQTLNYLGYNWKSYKQYLIKIYKNSADTKILSKTHPSLEERLSGLNKAAFKDGFLVTEGKKNENRFKDFTGV